MIVMVAAQFLFNQMSVFISRYSSGNICFLRGLGRADVMREFVRVLSRWKDFHGRSTRREFWMYCLVIFIASILLGVLDGFLFGAFAPIPDGEAFVMPLINFSNAFALITFIPGFSVSVRRLHDIDKSGWWLLICLTVIGAFLILYWNCVASDEVENTYGVRSIAGEATLPENE